MLLPSQDIAAPKSTLAVPLFKATPTPVPFFEGSASAPMVPPVGYVGQPFYPYETDPSPMDFSFLNFDAGIGGVGPGLALHPYETDPSCAIELNSNIQLHKPMDILDQFLLNTQ
ncbi:hypothetical protein CVT25_014782 [Psilocybe cyanescens]|uniref:Uncharacterized protein n=1 Tax=Psilocybe cyanescens TaxID=93625 RepID=A0A409XIC3_PSICY|nr:hypothetical protein CVT25_014782 [Psilocybe cyanescens]